MIDRVKGISSATAKYSLFGYFIATTFSHALGQIFIVRPHFGYFGGFIILFIGWSILSAIAGPTPLSSLFILKEEWLFLMIPVAASIGGDEDVLKWSLRLLTFSAIMVSLYAVWQHFSGLDLYHGTELAPAPAHGYRVTGFFSHRLSFGNYFAVASVLILGVAPRAKGKWDKCLFYTGFFLTALATAFSYSRGSIVVLILGVLIFLVLTGKKYIKTILIIIAALVIALLIISPDLPDRFIESFEVELEGRYGGSRLSIWGTAWRMSLDHPVFGVGNGNFKDLYTSYRNMESDRVHGHAHNDVLNIAAYAGFPAALFYLGFWIIIIVRIIKRLRRPASGFLDGVVPGTFLASVVFFMTSIYEASFADEEIRLLLMATWGLFLGVERIVKKPVERVDNIEKA
jgi:O-antigen ligase